MTEQVPRDFDRRIAARHDLSVHVDFDGTAGVTENVSSSGVLLVGPVETSVGAKVEVELELPRVLSDVGGRIRFTAEVVRIDEHPEGSAVAARFTDWQLVDAY